MHRAVATAALCAAIVGVPGCGPAPSVDGIPGSRVATMAEYQLEAMHSDLATGTMTCPTLHFAVDASVRCVRVAELSGGRQIRVLGTVTVTSTRDGGKLHVRLDDDVEEFGISGEHLDNDLRARTQRVLGVAPDDVRCPYLLGRKGSAVRCTVTVGNHTLVAPVSVVRVEPTDYRTVYRFSTAVFDRRLNPALPSLLRAIRRGGVAS
ncbi:MAG: hypothetical protein ACJ72L_21850 [Marmoricola sp.]